MRDEYEKQFSGAKEPSNKAISRIIEMIDKLDVSFETLKRKREVTKRITKERYVIITDKQNILIKTWEHRRFIDRPDSLYKILVNTKSVILRHS